MSTPETGATFVIPSGEYTPEALAPLIYHPDIAPETVSPVVIHSILPAFVAIARASLAREDMNTYGAWVARLEEYIDTNQQQAGYMNDELYAKLAECYFYGASALNIDAAGKLDAMLQTDHAGHHMSAIMKLCADNDAPPAQWISAHAHTPDQQARAWADYLQARQMRALRLGEKLSQTDLAVPGTDHFVENFLSEQLSPQIAINVAPNVLRLATTSADKQRIVDSYNSVIDALLKQPMVAHFTIRGITKFAAQVNQDPHITLSEKQHLEQRVLAIIANVALPAVDLYELELSAALARGDNANQILQLVSTIATVQEAAGQRNFRDTNLHTAARTYVARGDFNAAATIISMIDTGFVWRSALEYFMQNGGELMQVQEATRARQILQTLHSPVAETADGEARNDESAFIQGMHEQNFEQAERALLSIAERANASEYGEHLLIIDLAVRLLHHNPASAHIGPEFLQRVSDIRNFAYSAELYNLFTAYQAPGALEANRGFVQSRAHNAAEYFSLYSASALAETGHYNYSR